MTVPTSVGRRPRARLALLALTSAALVVGPTPSNAQIGPRDHPPESAPVPVSKGLGKSGPTTNALPGCGEGVPAAPVDGPSPPERKKLGTSPGGVDMRSGSLSFQNVDVSIGGEGDAGLGLARSFSFKSDESKFRQAFGHFFTHNWDIQLQERRLPRAGACYVSQYDYSETVVYGDLGDNFRRSGNVGTFQQTAPFGYAELVSTTSTSGLNGFVFTARDGTAVTFMNIASGRCPGVFERCGYATSVKRPDGTLYTLDYETLGDGVGRRLRSVVSNRGYALLFEYAGAVAGFQQLTKVCALNLTSAPKPSNDVCPSGVLAATYTYDGAVQTTATDAAGGTWAFGRPSASSFSLTRPGDAQPYMVASFLDVKGTSDDEPSFVVASQQLASGQTYDYGWSTLWNDDGQGGYSQQVLGGSWVDGQGHGNYVTFGSYYRGPPQGTGPVTYIGTPGPETFTDELGRTTHFNYCGSVPDGGQCYIPPLRSVTDPEGGVERFTYGAYRNLAEIRRVAKPGSPLADLVETRAYDSGAAPVARAKPLSITDARNNVTTFAYSQVHGGVLTETGPAGADGIQPVKRYAYVQRSAWISNGSGHQANPDAIWLLSDERSCRTTATVNGACAGGTADEVATSYDYGPDSGPNNLLPRGVVVTADGQSRRSCFAYDPQGNRIAETKPRAGLTSCP